MAKNDTGAATKADVREAVSAAFKEARKTFRNDLLDKLADYYTDFLKLQFDRLEGKVDKLEAGQTHIRRDITDLKNNMATRKEADNLKQRAERLESFHAN